MQVERQDRPPIGAVMLVALGLVLFAGLVVGALALGGFFNPPTSTRPPADLLASTPDAIANAPGVEYQLSIEVGEAGGLLGLNSSGQIDLEARHFAGSADRGRAASMLLFGGPERGSVVLADGLFVQADGGPWEAVPLENAAPLLRILDPSAMATAVAAVLEQAQVDPAVRTDPCGAATCQIVDLLLPPQVVSELTRLMAGEAQPPPADLLPIEAELWLDPGTGFPRRLAIEAMAGGTTSRIVLDLERLDPPPSIEAPAP